MTFLYYMENTFSTNQGDLNVCRSLQNEEWEVLEVCFSFPYLPHANFYPHSPYTQTV